MTELLETSPPSPAGAAEADGHVPAGWQVIRSGEHKGAHYYVGESPDGTFQRMVERPATEPDPDTMLLSIYKCEHYRQHAFPLRRMQNHLGCSLKHVQAVSLL